MARLFTAGCKVSPAIAWGHAAGLVKSLTRLAVSL
jgi:hypothetical protein